MKATVLQQIRLPRELKVRVERLARRNGISPSDLIRLSIAARLPECEAGRLLLTNDNLHNATYQEIQ